MIIWLNWWVGSWSLIKFCSPVHKITLPRHWLLQRGHIPFLELRVVYQNRILLIKEKKYHYNWWSTLFPAIYKLLCVYCIKLKIATFSQNFWFIVKDVFLTVMVPPQTNIWSCTWNPTIIYNVKQPFRLISIHI